MQQLFSAVGKIILHCAGGSRNETPGPGSSQPSPALGVLDWTSSSTQAQGFPRAAERGEETKWKGSSHLPQVRQEGWVCVWNLSQAVPLCLKITLCLQGWAWRWPSPSADWGSSPSAAFIRFSLESLKSFIEALTFFVALNTSLTAGNQTIVSENCFFPHFIKGICLVEVFLRK